MILLGENSKNTDESIFLLFDKSYFPVLYFYCRVFFSRENHIVCSLRRVNGTPFIISTNIKIQDFLMSINQFLLLNMFFFFSQTFSLFNLISLSFEIANAGYDE